MVPLLKPNKIGKDIESYQPINNLCAIEKIIEQYFQDSMIDFIELHSIMSIDHHGGMKLHSTQTAITQIYNKLCRNKERNMTSLLLCTDLNAAYDTVDHDILLKKLDHYGFKGKINNIMRSYLQDRKQYVQLDCFNSNIIKSPSCGTVQGGKMSGLLYNIYINELPLLFKLLNDKEYNKNTDITKNIDHTRVQFFDDISLLSSL